MEMKGLDEWRNYFRAASKGDIFDIIENGIKVAALDCPKEFKLRRDGIAELMFSCKWKSCLGCKNTESVEPGVGSKESKVSGENEMCVEQKDKGLSYVDVEALTDEIEEENQTLGEVLRIKELVDNSQDESDSTLYESLRKLELMPLNVDILKATEIGKSVNGLRKHGSKEICQLAKTLIDLWKNMVDEWYSATAIKDGTPDSVNPSGLDEEEGLPSPPLDAGAFFAAPQTDMDFSQFFDGIDDDGNPRDSGEFMKNHKTGRKPPVVNPIQKQGHQPANGVNALSKENIGYQGKKQEALVKVSKPLSTESGPGRPQRVNVEQKITNTIRQQQSSSKLAFQRRPLNAQQDHLKTSDVVLEQAKLEATKRKLQESYQQAENAKKQRTVQVMELHDLPKQGLVLRNPHMKPGSHNRQRGNIHRQFRF